MQHFLSHLDYPEKDLDVVTDPDQLIVGSPKQVLKKDINLNEWPYQ